MISKIHLIKTSDNSITLYDDIVQEAMHSTSGAYEEALLKHVLPSNILNKLYGPVFIIDIGFGLGYNILACLCELKRRSYDNIIKIDSFEFNQEYNPFLETIKFNDERDDIYSIIKTAYKKGFYSSNNINITIHWGDARSTIDSITDQKYDAVFHDPYSPSKNPELWTIHFFKKLYHIMADDALLTTYSSAYQIRRAMIEAGFIIGRGPSVGGKREGTIASKSHTDYDLTAEEINSIFKEIRSVPYCDRTLRDSRETILMQRQGVIKIIRSNHVI